MLRVLVRPATEPKMIVTAQLVLVTYAGRCCVFLTHVMTEVGGCSSITVAKNKSALT